MNGNEKRKLINSLTTNFQDYLENNYGGRK